MGTRRDDEGTPADATVVRLPPSAGPRSQPMRLTLAVDAGGDRRIDVTIEADAGARIGDVAAAIAAEVGLAGASPRALYSERLGAALDPASALGQATLRQGDRVALRTGKSAPKRAVDLGSPELVVAGGPFAGRRYQLEPGTYVIGRGESASVRLDDPLVSQEHALVEVGDHGFAIRDAGSRNGVYIDDRRVEAHVVEPDELVRIGRSLLRFERIAERTRDMGRSERGVLRFNRPPRVPKPRAPVTLTAPKPPDQPQRSRLPIAAAVVPAILGLVLYLVSRNIATLAFIALMPLMAIWSYVDDRRHGRRSYERNRTAFREELAALATQLDSSLRAETTAKRAAAPDPATLADRATRVLASLWERRPGQDDFLSLRIGNATQPADTVVNLPASGAPELLAEARAICEERTSVPWVPVQVALSDGGLALAGGAEPVHDLARWLVVQAATLHSPRDLVVVAVLGDGSRESWEWLKWLPHCSGEGSPLAGAHIAWGRSESTGVIERLRELLEARQADRAAPSGSRKRAQPEILVLLDEAVAPQPAFVERLFDAAALAVSAVWIGAEPDDVPGSARVVVEIPEPGAGHLKDARTGARETVLADGLSPGLARDIALALAPVRDTTDGGGSAALPAQLRLTPLLGFDVPDAAAIRERWRSSAGHRGAPIGVGARGPIEVDLRTDGPHGLIGGTTGSGKSELLQTLVAALAATHPPDRVTFLLIDYKGGAAFKDCVDLPHTVGFVTDLDGHLRSARPRLAGRRAAAARAPAARRGGERLDGHGAPLPRRRSAAPADRRRRVRDPRQGGAGIRRRSRRRRTARTGARRAPAARDPAPRGLRQSERPRQHEPPHRAARARRARQ